MDDERFTGWIMTVSIGLMGLVVLALIYLPDLRPEKAVLECDRMGGFWSTETGECQKTDSPAAGLAA